MFTRYEILSHHYCQVYKLCQYIKLFRLGGLSPDLMKQLSERDGTALLLLRNCCTTELKKQKICVFKCLKTIKFKLCQCLFVSPGEPHAICPNSRIQALEGDTVTLPCYLVPARSVVDRTFDWKRVDLNKVVYAYRHKQENPNDQMAHYRGRTTVNLDDLSRGNMTLQISSVQLADTGPYSCFVPKLETSCVTDLTVGEQGELIQFQIL